MNSKIKQLGCKYKNMSVQVKAGFWYTVCSMMQKGISFLAIPIFTRILTTEQYGTYSVFLSWLEIFDIIITFRLFTGGYTVGLLKFENEKDEYSSSMLSLSAFLTLIFGAIYVVGKSFWNQLFGMTTTMMLLMFVYLFSMPPYEFWATRQRFEFQYKKLVILATLLCALTPILGIVLTFFTSEKDVALVAGKTIVCLAFGIPIFISIFSKKPVLFRKDFWKYALQMNIPLIPYYLSMSILNHSDRLIINYLCGSGAAAFYSLAYSAAMVLILFNNALNNTLMPWLLQKIKKSEFKSVGSTVDFIVIILSAVNILFIAVAPELISIMAPSSYSEAIWIVPPIAASVLVMFIYQQFVNVEFYFEESRLIAASSVGVAILNIVLNFCLIPLFGYVAAAYTTLISYVVFCIVHFYCMNKICKKHGITKCFFNYKFLVGYTVIFLVVVMLLTILYDHIIYRYATIILLILFIAIKRKSIFDKLKTLKAK